MPAKRKGGPPRTSSRQRSPPEWPAFSEPVAQETRAVYILLVLRRFSLGERNGRWGKWQRCLQHEAKSRCHVEWAVLGLWQSSEMTAGSGGASSERHALEADSRDRRRSGPGSLAPACDGPASLSLPQAPCSLPTPLPISFPEVQSADPAIRWRDLGLQREPLQRQHPVPVDHHGDLGQDAPHVTPSPIPTPADPPGN